MDTDPWTVRGDRQLQGRLVDDVHDDATHLPPVLHQVFHTWPLHLTTHAVILLKESENDRSSVCI